MLLAWNGPPRTWLALAAAAVVVGAGPTPPAGAQQGYWRKIPELAAPDLRRDPRSTPAPGQEPGPAPSPDTYPREMELQAEAEDLERIEAGHESPNEGRLLTAPVTDLVVRIRHAVQSFGGRGGPSEAQRSYVEASVTVVAGGRISPVGIAQCGHFDGSMLVCYLECDGGWFGLRRGDEGEHFLTVGSSQRGEEHSGSRALRPGFRLSSCAAAGASRLLVLPRPGRLSAEIRLTERRRRAVGKPSAGGPD